MGNSEKYHERRQSWIDEHGPCANCGSDERLEIDHVDPAQKTIEAAKAFWIGGAKMAELDKCQVLCHLCHKAKTARELSRRAVRHGTAGAYRKWDCRCDPCTAAYYAHLTRYQGPW